MSLPSARCSGGNCPNKGSCQHAQELIWDNQSIYPVPAGSYCGFYVPVVPANVSK